MPSTALPRNVASYLSAIDAAAVFVTMPLHVGAATIPTLKRMPRSTSLVWLAWTRKIEDAERIVDATKRNMLSPGTARNFVNCLSAFCKWARKRGHAEVSFTEAIDLPKAGKGHLPWTEEQLAAAASKFSGVMRRGFLLYQHTGLRGSDVVRLGPTDVDTFQGRDAFALTTQKRKRDVWCPIMPTLAAECRRGNADRVRTCCSRTASVHAQGIRPAVCRGARCDPRTEGPHAARPARDGSDQPAPRRTVLRPNRRLRRHEREDGRTVLPQCRHAHEQPRRTHSFGAGDGALEPRGHHHLKRFEPKAPVAAMPPPNAQKYRARGDPLTVAIKPTVLFVHAKQRKTLGRNAENTLRPLGRPCSL